MQFHWTETKPVSNKYTQNKQRFRYFVRWLRKVSGTKLNYKVRSGQCGGSEECYVCVMLGLHLASQIRRGRWCAGNSFFAVEFVELEDGDIMEGSGL